MDALKKQASGRLQFHHQGQLIYEWEQSLDEVNVYIHTPPGITASEIACDISAHHVTLGLKANLVHSKFLDFDLFSAVVVDESYWMLDGQELNMNLQKMKKGLTWSSVFVGHEALNPVVQEEVSKKMMLERFGVENPGFDFSQAEFSGQAPDARTFMGGVKYT